MASAHRLQHAAIYAIRPELGIQMPGTPFLLASLLVLAATALAWRVTR